MRIFALLLSLALSVDAYGGYGSQSPAFKSRADFEPKEQTLSPVLPPGDSPYNTPPPIPMPDKSSSSSSEEKGCGDNIHTTTAAPSGCGPSAHSEHVHVDNESGAPLQKVLPAQVGYGEVEKPQEVKPAVAVSEYGATAPAPQPAPETPASHFSSATKEEVELYGIQVPASSTTSEAPTQAPVEVPVQQSTKAATIASSAAPYEQTEVQPSTTASTTAAPSSSVEPYEQPQPVSSTAASSSVAPVSPSSTASTSAPIEVSPAAASASPVSAGGGYEGGEDETPAQEIARVPDNNNLYEKIAEIPSTPSTTVSTTAATVPYEAPAPQTSAPYQPPAPRAQIPTSTASSGYDIINEVEAPEKTSEPYGGQKVEAAHITEETGSDYDETENNGNTQQTSHSSSQTYSKTSSTSDGYDQTSSQSSKQQSVVPSAQPYRPQTSNTNNYQQIGSFRQAGNGYNAGGSSYTQAGGGYSQPQSFLPPAPVSYVQPQPSFVPQPSSYVQSGSYSQQSSSNGCCGGSWFSSQGSLCAPVNYNPCQSSSSYSSGGCGQQSFGGCGQQSFGSGCGSSCACSSAPTCTPCTPVSSGCASSCAPACTPSCPPPAQQCCCQQPAANPFASLCGGRKKRSIQTLLGICGRRRRL